MLHNLLNHIGMKALVWCVNFTFYIIITNIIIKIKYYNIVVLINSYPNHANVSLYHLVDVSNAFGKQNKEQPPTLFVLELQKAVEMLSCVQLLYFRHSKFALFNLSSNFINVFTNGNNTLRCQYLVNAHVHTYKKTHKQTDICAIDFIFSNACVVSIVTDR